jgi:tRNA G18 (ribose-2'-O)-methylase SpoU
MCHIATMPEMKDAKDHADFMKMLKKAGFYTVCAAKTAECTELFDFEPCFPAVLFVGGEKRGISPDFVANCDDIVSIPYFSDAKFSLPTASTCAIIGFEFGKRLSKDKKFKENSHGKD